MRYLLLIVLLTAHVASAAHYCGSNDLQFEDLLSCTANCSDSCIELSPVIGAGSCPSGVSNFIYDRQTGKTYGVSDSVERWNLNDQFIADNEHKGDLVTVLTSLSGKAVWLGLYDIIMSTAYGVTNTSNYSWLDNTQLTYDNFASGEPDNSIDGDDIGVVPVYGEHWVYAAESGKWYDDGYHASYGGSYKPKHYRIAEYQGMLDCVSGLPEADPTTPGEIISNYCSLHDDDCYLCVGDDSIQQCYNGTDASGDFASVCPDGLTSCESVFEEPLCPGGGILNGLIDMCQLEPVVNCDAGYSYDYDTDTCYQVPDCPFGGVLNKYKDICQIALTDGSCPAGYDYDPVNDGCVTIPDCSMGAYVASNDRCEFTVDYNCPAGFDYNYATGVCESDPICPAGSTYSVTRYKCLQDAVIVCPDGFTYNGASGTCEASLECPEGMLYDEANNICYEDAICSHGSILKTFADVCALAITDNDCPDGYTLDVDNDVCEKAPTCSMGAYVASNDRCEFSVSYSCPTGYTYNESRGVCEKDPVCPTGTTYSATSNRCVVAATLSCPSGYSMSGGICVRAPICSTGFTYNNSTNRCEKQNYYQCSLTGTKYTTSTACTNNCKKTTTATSTTSCNTVQDGPAIEYYEYLGYRFYVWDITCAGTAANVRINQYPNYDLRLPISGAKVSIPSTGAYTWLTLSNSKYYVTVGNYTGTTKFIFSDYMTAATSYSCPTGYTRTGTTCTKTGTCTLLSCPSGSVKSGNLCIANPTCTYGGTFDATQDRCELTPTKNCPAGTTYSATVGACIVAPTCSDSGTLNTTTDLCNLTPNTSCPDGYTKDGDICYSTPVCAEGEYDIDLNMCVVSGSSLCPSGFYYNTSLDRCQKQPECDNGEYDNDLDVCTIGSTCPVGTINNDTDVCEFDVAYDCEDGFTYKAWLGMCVKAADCLSPGTLDIDTDKCYYPVTRSCPSGYIMEGELCYSDPVCDIGIYDESINKCILSASTLCPDGYTFNPTRDRCEEDVPCPNPSVYEGLLNWCVYAPDHECTNPYSYAPPRRKCETIPICYDSIYNPDEDKCHSGSCPYSGSECVDVSGVTGSPDFKCSPYDCLDAADPAYSDVSGDTQEGAYDKQNDGEKDDGGQCLGQIYIFNGGDRRCRPPGTQTGFSDCCTKDETWFGLGECSPNEQALSALRDWGELDGQCHYVGEYCAEKWGICPACICVQKKKTYCCFGSPLGRIIAEQGRDQLGFGFGSAEEPNCRGFTPDEFQKLDFSKINFSEWLETYVLPEMMDNINGTIVNTFENIELPEGN